MAVEMEGLEFQIETTTSEAVKGVDALANTFRKFKTLTKGGLGLGSSVKQLEKLDGVLKKFDTSKLEGLGKALESVSKLGEVKISGNVAKQLGNIADVMDRITLADVERLEDMAKALRDLGEVSNVKIPKIRVQASGAATDVVTPTTGSAATSGMTQATSQVQEVSAAVEQVTQKTISFKSVLSGVGGVFKKGFSLGIGVLHKLANAMTKVASTAGKAVKNLLGFKKTSAGTASHVRHVTSGLGKLYDSFKRIAMYRLVRFALSMLIKALKEGVNNIYQYSAMMGGAFAVSMNSAATNVLYLKNSLGAMAAPIINALAPAIDFVCGKIATLLNMINMLIARLSGSSTYTAAKKLATAYGGAADSAAGAAKDAADKIKHYTSGIDELNIFQKQEDNASGGGGGGADYGSMFEEVPIDSNISDFADRLKQAFDTADWKTLGTLVGDKVNEIIDSVDYANIGSKLGFGINGAIQTAYYFLDTVDFHKIGVHVAELLNNALSEVDTSFIGKTLIQWFAIKWEFLIGFLSELDWGLAASKLFDGFSGALDEVTSLLNQYDWTQMGTDLWTNIKEVFANIDWAGIAQSIFTFLGTALRSCIQFLGGFFGSIGADIKAWWDTEIQGEDWKETASNLLKAIGQGFLNIGTWVYENIVSPFCTALLGEDVWADVEQAGKDMWDGFCNGLTEFFADPGGWIKTNIVDPFVKWFKDLFGIHSPSTVMAEIGGDVIQGLLNGILAPFKNIGKWVEDNIVQPLKDAFGDTDLAEFTVGVKNTASTWWSNVCSWWNRKVGAVQSFTTNVANHATTWWNNTKTWWSGKVGKVKEFTTSVTNQASTWWSNVNRWWDGKVGAVQQFTTSVKNESATWWSNVKTWWSGRVGAVEQFTTSVANQATTWWSNVKTWWSGKVGAVKEFTTSVKNDSATWWSNVKTWWSGKVGTLSVGVSIVNAASTWWSNVKTWWNNACGSLSTTLSIKVPKVEVKWSTVTVFGKDYSYPSGFNLKWNAKGGILDGAQIFGMMGNTLLGGGEAGREAVLPLDTHTEWMDTLAQKVRDGLPGEGGGGGYTEFRRALEDFYNECVQPTMTQMAADVQRQANKKEQTTVQIGNRTITDAVTTQQNANGYRFAK